MTRTVFMFFGLIAVAGTMVAGRTFTNMDGRTIEAELISVTQTEVVIKLKGKLRTHTIKIETLSEADQEFIEERREELEAEARELAAAEEKKAIWKAMSRGARNVVEFVEENNGKKVGDGECWTLANEAFKSAGISRPGADLRVWGGVVEWKNEEVLPGDILELKSAKFSNGLWSAPQHTAVVMRKSGKDGKIFVYHQNWGKPGKKVSQILFDLNQIVSGGAVIYRYGKR